MRRSGELLITAGGVEGGLIYACVGAGCATPSQADGSATVRLDLLPAARLPRVAR